MFTPLRAVARDPEGKVLLTSAILMIGVGTIVYSVLEGWSLLDSLYFSVVTLATVGFGDLTPTTDGAKLFTVAYILAGVGILAAFVSELAKHRRDSDTLASRVDQVAAEAEAVIEESGGKGSADGAG